MEDWQLLEEFSRHGSQAAFTQLVERHLGLVLTSARRQVGDDAEDVAQAVFLLLAQKAGSLGRKVVLSGWLFRTTRFVAARAVRSEARRQRREQAAFVMTETHTPEVDGTRLARALDENLAGLAEADRNALLLRFADGRNHREVGVAMGLTEEAAKKRVNRALDRLRLVFAGQGVTLSVLLLASCLAERLVAAPPAGLAATISHQAISGQAASGTAVELARQITRTWRWAKVQLVAVYLGVGVVALVGAAVVMRPQSRRAPTPQSVAGVVAAVPAKQIMLAAPARARLSGERLHLQVVAADSGEAISAATVLLNFVVAPEWIAGEDLITDAQGRCDIPLPRGDLLRLDIGVNAPGWESRFMTWRSDWQFPRPETYVLKLARGETVGGRVVDEQQRPLRNVTVWRCDTPSDCSWREPEEDRERTGFVRRWRVGATDAQGRWICSSISPGPDRVRFDFEHPQYVTTAIGSDARRGPSLANFKAREVVTVLAAGAVTYGQVVNPQGEPIAGARIATAKNDPGVVTDREGNFSLQYLPKGEASLVATAAGFAPKLFAAVAGGPATRVQLEAGAQLRVRIVTTHQQPIAGATLTAAGTDDLASRYGLLTAPPMYEWSDVTDADGWVTWSSAPPRKRLNFRADARGYAEREVRLVAEGAEQTVTLEALPAQPPLFEGTVTDATTGENISRFKAIPAVNTQFPYLPQYDRSSLYYGTNGNYRLSPAVHRIRIEAVGYVPAVGHPQPGPNGEVRGDFRLIRDDPAQRIRGVVYNPDGTPAAGVEVALCTLDEGTYLMPGKLVRVDDNENEVTKFGTITDSAGHYEFPNVRAPHTVVAASPNGFGRARARTGQATEVRLEAFGTIAGVVVKEGVPLAGVTVQLVDRSYDKYPGTVLLDPARFRAVSDDQGRFSIGSVPAGENPLFIEYDVGLVPGAYVPVQVTAGQTTSVVLGDPDPRGRGVGGHVRASAAGFIGDWSRQLVGHYLIRIVPQPQPPKGLSEEDWQLWLVAWHQSEFGRSAARDAVVYRLEVSADGTFSAAGVRPGKYQLHLRAGGDEPAPGWFAREQREVIIPEADGSDGTVDLGEMILKIQQRIPR